MEINKVRDCLYEIPAASATGMNVPARILADDAMMEQIRNDRTVGQIVNVACLPGIVGHALVMPDAHEGYGFPIGGVAATRFPDGVISPGGIGYDINCGVRLLKTRVCSDELARVKEKLLDRIYSEIPSGIGKSGKRPFRGKGFDRILEEGVPRALKEGFGGYEDELKTESGGYLETADRSCISERARDRGLDQIGTLGGGNHFIELAKVEKIYDAEIAREYGLYLDQVVVMLHTGSRGLGHQIATDYIRILMKAYGKYHIELRDKELVCVPLSSSEGKRYHSAMSCAANYAWVNRQVISYWIQEVWKEFFEGEKKELSLLYDVAHNIAKIENHMVGGISERLIVHRKGATRAFGPGNMELPLVYREVGQPVIVPGSMGTASYVMAGRGEPLSFSSCCHGAGRRLSRSAAKRKINGYEVIKELKRMGISTRVGSMQGAAEEAPEAYKDVDSVVDVVETLGIARKVVRTKPLAVIKG
jgi:tRNA-splicing ligase RtcB